MRYQKFQASPAVLVQRKRLILCAEVQTQDVHTIWECGINKGFYDADGKAKGTEKGTNVFPGTAAV